MNNISRIAGVIILTITASCLADVNSAPQNTADINTVVKTAPKIVQQDDKPVKLLQENERLKTENVVMEKAVKAYEKSVIDLRVAFGLIVGLVGAYVSIMAFRNTREYREAIKETKEAAKEAKETAKEAEKAAENARNWEEKSSKVFRGIDTKVQQKLEEIEKRADKIITDKSNEVIKLISEIAKEERKKSQEEAEKERQANELQVKSLHEMYLGITILDQALKKEGVESDNLFEQSYTKFKKAIEIKLDMYLVLKYWGGALLYQAQKKEGQEKKKLVQEAREKSLQAEQIKKGGGAYNLACIAAIEGNEEECKKWLKIGEEAGELENREWAMKKDEDLKAYWDKDWFKAIKWKGEK
ncbi:MAG: hypothetical protein KJ757_00925 [Planctomycetes bacterium]|nr:hypothetical protein [Planctomycetota bacterium]MBU1518087.1 hypothetical protein [Planctomycetota bacterium]MBU2458526.1 hypothetical protein [Planctomycetota bacterium]MBU2596117.1 hypothetical protein [Planctomycetota bacterium]